MEPDFPASPSNSPESGDGFPTPNMTAPAQIVPSSPAPVEPDQPPVSGLEPGLDVTALEVRLLGATPELEEIIRQAIQTRPGAVTSQAQLQADVTAILNTGLFADANAISFDQPDGINVLFEVEPIVVRSLQLAGARVLPLDFANEFFQPQFGQPISPDRLRQAVQQTNQWYADNGYTLAQVLTLGPAPDGTITMAVAEGIIGTITIQFVNAEGSPVDEEGNPIRGRTDEDFIRREIQLQPGQVFNQNDAQRDLQQLFNLGLFDDANINLDGTSDAVNVTYNLNERLSRSFNLGGGINDDDGLFGTVTYEDLNVGGVGERLSLDVQVSGRGPQFGANFTSPYRASRPDRLGYSVDAFRRRRLSQALSDEVTLANGDTARESRFGGGFSVLRPLGDWDGRLGLNYTRISIEDEDGDAVSEDEQGNPLTFSDSGRDDLATVLFQISQDRRDRPVNPTSGTILSLSTEQSIPIGDSSILLNRLRANFVQYVPVSLVDASTEQDTEMLAFNLQAGTIIGDAPPYEAFPLGGGSSVRGYGEGGLGTGRSYVLAAAEYRVPLFSPVGGVLFADFATDLGSGDTVLGSPADVRDKPGTGFGLGLGLRVRSPIGLIRADYGFNDEGDSRFHFGIGERF